MAVCLTGMHRTGTSMVAALLHHCGLYLGDNTEFIKANEQNEKGFWEHRHFVEINKSILSYFGSSWDSPPSESELHSTSWPDLPEYYIAKTLIKEFNEKQPWGWKDPRNCLTFPFWKTLIPDLKVVLCLRHPVEIARSLNKRNQHSSHLAYSLFNTYYESALDNLDAKNCIVTLYDNYFKKPEIELLRLVEFLGIDCEQKIIDSAVQKIASSLRHHALSSREKFEFLLPQKTSLLFRHLHTMSDQFYQPVPNDFDITSINENTSGTSEVEKRIINLRSHLDSKLFDLYDEQSILQNKLKETTSRLSYLEKAFGEMNLDISSVVIPRCVPFSQISRIHTHLKARFPGKQLVFIETNIGHIGQYPTQVRIIEHRASRFLARELAKLQIPNVFPDQSAVVVPFAKNDSIGYEELLKFATEHGFKKRFILLPDGSCIPYPLHAGQTDFAWPNKFVLVPRCVPYVHFSGYLDRLKREFPEARITILESNPDITKRYPKEHTVLPWHDDKFTAQGLIDFCDSQLTMEDCRAVVIPISNVDGGGFGELLTFAQNAPCDTRLALMSTGLVLQARNPLDLDLVKELPVKAGLPAHSATEVGAEYLGAAREILFGEFRSDSSLFTTTMKAQAEKSNNPFLRNKLIENEAQIQSFLDKAPASTRNPLVSIVMPTYNRANTIGEAIESVLDQSYKNWELHIADDGSTDNTEEIVASYKDDRITLHRIAHGGAVAARNYCLERARGEYIAYLDSDNFWHREFLSVMVSKMTMSPEKHCAYSGYFDTEFQSGNYSNILPKLIPFSYRALQERNFIDLSGFFHKIDLYKHLGGMTKDLPRLQDWDLILKFAFVHDPVFVDLLLFCYRRNENWQQLSYTQADKTFETRQRIFENLESLYTRKSYVGTIPEKKSVSIICDALNKGEFDKATRLISCISPLYETRLICWNGDEQDLKLLESKNKTRCNNLETKNFPDLFSNISKAVANLYGDVVYSVGQGVLTAGVSLLANYHYGKPVVLDMESETQGVDIAGLDLLHTGLLNPRSFLWKEIISSLNSTIPNKSDTNTLTNERPQKLSISLHNILDEKTFAPDTIDRDAIKTSLGIRPHDITILLDTDLFDTEQSGYHMRHFLKKEGSFYRLLIINPRPSRELNRLIGPMGNRIITRHEDDASEIARLVSVADAYVAWLDPDLNSNKNTIPVNAVRSMAMKVPILANSISEFATWIEQGYLLESPFMDFRCLIENIHSLKSDGDRYEKMLKIAHQLFIRQFSSKSSLFNLHLLLHAFEQNNATYGDSTTFAELFSEFREKITK